MVARCACLILLIFTFCIVIFNFDFLILNYFTLQPQSIAPFQAAPLLWYNRGSCQNACRISLPLASLL